MAYCDCCNVVEVKVEFEYCDGCVNDIMAYLEKDELAHQEYMAKLESKLADYDYSDQAN